MKKLRFLCLLFPVLNAPEAIAQFEQSFEFQANSSASAKNEDVKLFYTRYDTFIDQLKDSNYTQRDTQNMIFNFVIFTEEGIIMKDLEFHSAESCKKIILLGKAELGNDRSKPWLYVDMESHINLKDLERILAFLREAGIDYQFGKDEEYHPLTKKH